jgi:hypothetical protein
MEVVSNIVREHFAKISGYSDFPVAKPDTKDFSQKDITFNLFQYAKKGESASCPVFKEIFQKILDGLNTNVCNISFYFYF